MYVVPLPRAIAAAVAAAGAVALGSAAVASLPGDGVATPAPVVQEAPVMGPTAPSLLAVAPFAQ